MKILLYDWCQTSTYINQQDIHDTLKQLGISFDSFLYDYRKHDISELEAVFDKISADTYDCCFSINYFPEISDMCNAKGLKYISWGYDCPFDIRNIEKTLGNLCNRVYCFDRIQAETYRKMGFDTVYHMPLAVNAGRYKKVIPSAAQRKRYAAQISFVGSLYESPYPTIAEFSTDYKKGYMDAVINIQQQLYGAYILNDVIDDKFVQEMNEYFKVVQPDTIVQLDKPGLVHVLDQETSRRERIILLNLLGSRFDTKLYSTQEYPILHGVECRGPVDYYNEMPYVFAASDINLNISVKGIQSGIPQRALDVMASGGFLLSNYQQELVELFSYGEDMVVYESMEDAVEKCSFYLKHDELRHQIALNGRQRVFEQHDLKDVLGEILTSVVD